MKKENKKVILYTYKQNYFPGHSLKQNIMMKEEDTIFAGLLIMTMGLIVLRRKRSLRWLNRQWWVRPINHRSPHQGDFCHLLQEIKEAPQMFFRYTRMTVSIFKNLLEKVRPLLIKKSHRALVPEERLAITLRYDFFSNSSSFNSFRNFFHR